MALNNDNGWGMREKWDGMVVAFPSRTQCLLKCGKLKFGVVVGLNHGLNAYLSISFFIYKMLKKILQKKLYISHWSAWSWKALDTYIYNCTIFFPISQSTVGWYEGGFSRLSGFPAGSTVSVGWCSVCRSAHTVTEVRTPGPVTYLRISKFTHSDTIKKNCGDYEFTTLNFGMWISRQVLKGAGEIDDLIN